MADTSLFSVIFIASGWLRVDSGWLTQIPLALSVQSVGGLRVLFFIASGWLSQIPIVSARGWLTLTFLVLFL